MYKQVQMVINLLYSYWLLGQVPSHVNSHLSFLTVTMNGGINWNQTQKWLRMMIFGEDVPIWSAWAVYHWKKVQNSAGSYFLTKEANKIKGTTFQSIIPCIIDNCNASLVNQLSVNLSMVLFACGMKIVHWPLFRQNKQWQRVEKSIPSSCNTTWFMTTLHISVYWMHLSCCCLKYSGNHII